LPPHVRPSVRWRLSSGYCYIDNSSLFVVECSRCIAIVYVEEEQVVNERTTACIPRGQHRATHVGRTKKALRLSPPQIKLFSYAAAQHEFSTASGEAHSLGGGTLDARARAPSLTSGPQEWCAVGGVGPGVARPRSLPERVPSLPLPQLATLWFAPNVSGSPAERNRCYRATSGVSVPSTSSSRSPSIKLLSSWQTSSFTRRSVRATRSPTCGASVAATPSRGPSPQSIWGTPWPSAGVLLAKASTQLHTGRCSLACPPTRLIATR
jgi:hypothetical protein